MLLVSEWLPNPVGTDAAGEWIEVLNNGTDPVPLAGWSIVAGTGKRFVIRDGILPSGERKVFARAETKLSLINTDGRLALYNPRGVKRDEVSFVGAAPEGKSASRVGNEIFFTAPTPGAPNDAKPAVALRASAYPTHTSLVPALRTIEWMGLALAVGCALAAAVFFSLIRNAELHHALFESND